MALEDDEGGRGQGHHGRPAPEFRLRGGSSRRSGIRPHDNVSSTRRVSTGSSLPHEVCAGGLVGQAAGADRASRTAGREDQERLREAAADAGIGKAAGGVRGGG